MNFLRGVGMGGSSFTLLLVNKQKSNFVCPNFVVCQKTVNTDCFDGFPFISQNRHQAAENGERRFFLFFSRFNSAMWLLLFYYYLRNKQPPLLVMSVEGKEKYSVSLPSFINPLRTRLIKVV